MGHKSPEYLDADKMQKSAADPTGTRLASANAGSGKTRVLVNRVSRLLLTGTKPEKILCLTYTKAAASEMQSRLFDTLGGWSIFPEKRLKEELRKLLPDEVALPELSKARTLFASALETPEGLKVQTIHAFCERILSRFPIESGILPGFEPIDDADMRLIKQVVRDELYQAAAADPKGELNKSIQILAAEKADQTLDGLFNWMAGSPDKVRQWTAQGGIKALAEHLNLPLDANPETFLENAWDSTPHNMMRQAAASLLDSPSKGDVTRGHKMLAAFDITEKAAAFRQYVSAFLTAKGTPLKSIVTQKAPELAQNFFGLKTDNPSAETDRVIDVNGKVQSAFTLSMTRALLTVSQHYVEAFEKAKRRNRGLDFNDQIHLVRDLLLNKEVSDWVRYKLDGGIEHILVDEAQDTAPVQWDIIDALAEAFIQDSPDRDTRFPRTMFAVGDEKQSIYSFQGAKPERLREQIAFYSRNTGRAVEISMSFRSAQDVLDVVDAVLNGNRDGTGAFMRMLDIKDDLPPPETVLRHNAFRDDRGLVELWPAVNRPEKSEENDSWDTRPVDATGQSDSREQLAVAVATKIKTWLDEGEPIYDRDLGRTRPMQAGDILILVRQRNAFFDAIIRNLKVSGVAVAGADRLKLKDSIAVKDLLSLAKFVLLPSDDLSLAETLKSPLAGYNETELFSVSIRREGSLWSTVQDRRPETAVILSEMIAYSRRFAPYEFFARVLDMTGPDGDSVLKNMFARLGLEAKDAIEAFLARALAHQRRGSPSLQHFVQSFLEDDQELKREMDAGGGQVRVMTVHGAKGLEAPVVFLPDTTQVPKAGESVLPFKDGYVLALSEADTPAALLPYKEAVKRRKMQEYLRLLYVAMTRAESRLIICGYKYGHGTGRYHDESWYAEVKAAFEHLKTQDINTPFGDVASYGERPLPPENMAANENTENKRLPPWINQPAPNENLVRRKVTPSHLLAEVNKDVPARSPLAADTQTRFLRGNLIHKLLEILPELSPDKRVEAAEKILSDYPGLDAEQIQSEVFTVLDHPEFAPIFAEGSRAEISLAGTAKTLPDHLYLNAQIDRISVTEDRVFIVDYKSNRPPPLTQDGVADIYWGQMAAYRELAREIYPAREVVCALLWTDGPNLMILDENRLDEALTQIAALPT